MATPKKKAKTPPELTSDFRELLKSFHKHRVRYLLIGGYAVGVHGHSRSTRDIDFWIALDPENAKRVSDALADFAFPARDVPPEMFLKKETVFRFGRDPWRVELLTKLSGVEFEECWRDHIIWRVDDLAIPVISLHHLRKNKLASGRFKDLADLEELPPTAPPAPPQAP